MRSWLVVALVLGGCRYGASPDDPVGTSSSGGFPPQSSRGGVGSGASSRLTSGSGGGSMGAASGATSSSSGGPQPDAIVANSRRSAPIALDGTESLLAAALRDANRVDVFEVTGMGFFASSVHTVEGVEEPRSVAFHPDGSLWMVGRNGLQSARPFAQRVDGPPISACAEPTSLVLSRRGDVAFVGCLDGVVFQVDTWSWQVRRAVDLRGARDQQGRALPANAAVMALALTEDGNDVDGDETLVVPLFWAEPLLMTSPSDADLAGLGVVALLSPEGEVKRRVDLLPLPDVGRAPGVGAFMNQLSAVVVVGDLAFVAGLAASPRGPAGPGVDTVLGMPDGGGLLVAAGSNNVFPMVSVISIAGAGEIRRININALLAPRASFTGQGPSRLPVFLSTPSAVAAVPNGRTSSVEVVVVSSASESMVGLDIPADGTEVTAVGFGETALLLNGTSIYGQPVPPVGFQEPGLTPTGIAVVSATPAGLPQRLMVLHETTQDVQEFGRALGPTADPQRARALPNTDAAIRWRRGKHFFMTSSGRWGNQGQVGCLACHPGNGALSDNVTWYFGPGPRQTIALDALYGRTGDILAAAKTVDDHRAQTWTANTDEIADLETNTRNVGGGFGALYRHRFDAGPGVEERINLDRAGPPPGDGGAAPVTGLRNSSNVVCQTQSQTQDWLDIQDYLLTLRRPRGLAWGDGRRVTLVAQGRQVFEAGGCARCHGGTKWSSSRIPYVPERNSNGRPQAELAHLTPYNQDGGNAFNQDRFVVAGDDTPVDLDAGVPSPVLERLACVLRNVGTYFVDGGQSPLEVRGNMVAGNHAQGRAGYNPPGLGGLRYSAPYLHRGQAHTLRALFLDETWTAHRTAGNPLFSPTPDQVDALVAFLESIDDETPVVPPPADFNLCPSVY